MPSPPSLVSEKVHEYLYTARACIITARTKNSDRYHRTVSAHARWLREKYPFYERVLLYQLVVGGTLDFKRHDIIDFPDPDSLLCFLQRMVTLLS